MTKIPLTQDISQSMKIPFEDDFINLKVDFRVDRFVGYLTYKEKTLNGFKLATNVLLLTGQNMPFELTVFGDGYDASTMEDFINGKYELLLLDREETELIRGYSVE